MIGPINVVPRGIGNFLQLKGDEGLLRFLEDSVRPTIDIFDFLVGGVAFESVSQNANFNALGTVAYSNLVVPVNEQWVVRGFGWTCITGAAEIFRGYGLSSNASGGNVNQLTDESASSLTDAAGVGAPGAMYRGRPFMLYPGESLLVRAVRITTAGNIAVTAFAQFYRFRSG